MPSQNATDTPRQLPELEEFEVELFHDCQLYLDTCAEFMTSDPFTTNVIGVVATGIAKSARPKNDEDLFIAVRKQNEVVGMAMHTPPHNLFVSRMPTNPMAKLAHSLHEMRHQVPGVTGERTTVTAFAHVWTTLTGSKSKVLTAMRMYRLKKLHPPTDVAGSVRVADSNDIPLVRQWLTDFSAEATPHSPNDEVSKLAERRIKAGEIFLWICDTEVVSLAGISAAVCGVARIGPVYTPLAHRGHGFGSGVTAAASRSALDLGARHVALYTDLSNPTSNAIYQNIGFVPDHDGQERVFEPASK